MVKLLLVIATMISLSVFGCATTDQRLEGERGLGQEQQEFRERMENELSGLDTRMDELAEQANQLPENSQAEFNERMKQLEEQRPDIQDRLDQIPEVTQDEWQGFTNDVQTAVNDLQQATNDLAEEFNL